MSTNNFSNSILITGANRGMGLGFVRHYLEKGLFVVATARALKNANELMQLDKAYPKQLLMETLEISNEISIASFAKRLKKQEIQFDLAINNAGISIGEAFGAWTMASFEAHLKVNTIGPALLSQAIVPLLNPGAKLVQMSSGMGSLEWNIGPDNPFDAYAVSKAALNMLRRRLAEKLGPKGIIVFAINPGWVKTEMGGPEAPTTIEAAIRNMCLTIERISMEQSGCFFGDDGALIPW